MPKLQVDGQVRHCQELEAKHVWHSQSGRAGVAENEDADGRDGLEEGWVADNDDLLVPGSGLRGGLGTVGNANRDGERDDGGEDCARRRYQATCSNARRVGSRKRTRHESNPSEPADLAERADARCR